jgi:hypothetical protein
MSLLGVCLHVNTVCICWIESPVCAASIVLFSNDAKQVTSLGLKIPTKFQLLGLWTHSEAQSSSMAVNLQIG